MRNSILMLAAAALVLVGCAHSGPIVQAQDGFNMAQFRGVGVVPFQDAHGQGMAIATAIENGLEKQMFDPVDPAIMNQIFTQYKVDRRQGIGLEALETIRDKTAADVVMMGRMAPDWSAAEIMMVDTSMGDQVLRAIVTPTDKKQKVFSSPDEIAKTVLKVLSDQH